LKTCPVPRYGGRVLTIAGSDSGGGAGIQADIKTVTALGGYAATAITALTAQNTVGIYGVVGIDPAFVASQIEVVLDDIGADCIKTGMLYSQAVVNAVCDVLEAKAAAIPLVVDPIRVAKDGTVVLPDTATATLKRRLLGLTTVLTPNVPEAQVLTGVAIHDPEQMIEAASMLLISGPKAVLIKGGHLAGEKVYDVLVSHTGSKVFESPRIDTRHTHGTGCTLASAIATGIAQGMDIHAAVVRARNYVFEAIRYAPGLGQGQGPLNHNPAPQDV
jgi:hydroxymethylpyrimidine/phosphomethylpyrimidine kinase